MVITFLSDYGTADPFVGMCHAVIARMAPAARVLDLTHGVPRHDVAAGAVLLADCMPYVPAGVTLAVVDPGVGTARRGVAVRGEGGHWFVGPDNGLLGPAVALSGGAVAALELAVPQGTPATFHGRDVFAPAAARLAGGGQPDGRPLDPAALVTLALPAAQVTPGSLTAAVLLVDGFGNLSLAAGPGDLAAAGLRAGQVDVNGRRATLGRTFGDVAQGELVVFVDASGRVAVAVNGGSAAQRLHLRSGAVITLH
jgi:S-adenosylmethionine hydrolase